MSDILCVTGRNLCKEDFLTRIDKLAKENPAGIILREKDLSEKDYKSLAKAVMDICNKYDVPCILHSFVKAAGELGSKAIHLPLSVLRTLSDEDKVAFTTLGASCHSVEDAIQAEKFGCAYIIAGHVFDTDCKKGLPGRGINFLQMICESVSVPVYAIGGINAKNIANVIKAGAKGACIMSGAMLCKDPKRYLETFKER